MGLRSAAAAAAFVLLITACDGSSSSVSESDSASSPTEATTTEVVEEPAPVGGLLATIGTNRLYSLERGFGLGLRNVGDEPVVVRQLQLVSPRFEIVPMVTEEVLLQPDGRRFVLPLPYGEARCDGDAGETDAAMFPTLVVVDDGDQLRVPAVEEYSGAVGRLHASECAAADVRERADVRLGDHWTRNGEAVMGELVLEQRRPGNSVSLDDARGSVMFTIRLEGDEAPALRVTDDEPMATVPIEISVARCDPHALAEAKRSFIFLTWVAVGDADPVPVEFEATGAARAALDGLLATCQP
jgi:hypothetical protein